MNTSIKKLMKKYHTSDRFEAVVKELERKQDKNGSKTKKA